LLRLTRCPDPAPQGLADAASAASAPILTSLPAAWMTSTGEAPSPRGKAQRQEREQRSGDGKSLRRKSQLPDEREEAEPGGSGGPKRVLENREREACRFADLGERRAETN